MAGGTLSYRTISLDSARKVADAAMAAAAGEGVPACIAVVGRDGHPVLSLRMDGAPLLSVNLAADKAWTVTAFGLPTHEWWDIVSGDPALLHGITKTDRLIIFGGGVPIRDGGELVGAVGVSGGSADQDRSFAEAGSAAFEEGAP